MISAVNLLVDAHHARFGHDFIDNLIDLRMSKRFMEKVRREFFSSIVFHDDLSDEHDSSNKEWKH